MRAGGRIGAVLLPLPGFLGYPDNGHASIIGGLSNDMACDGVALLAHFGVSIAETHHVLCRARGQGKRIARAYIGILSRGRPVVIGRLITVACKGCGLWCAFILD